MKKISTVLAAAAFLCALLPDLASALTPEELFRQVSPAVWVVIPRDAQGRALGSGSAVVVSPGRLITNCHVLRSAASITLRREREERPATLEYPDPERDLCQLKADNLPPSTLGVVPRPPCRSGRRRMRSARPEAWSRA